MVFVDLKYILDSNLPTAHAAYKKIQGWIQDL